MVTELGAQEERDIALTGMISRFSIVYRIDRTLEAFYLYQEHLPLFTSTEKQLSPQSWNCIICLERCLHFIHDR
jgi:hypothetical protein